MKIQENETHLLDYLAEAAIGWLAEVVRPTSLGFSVIIRTGSMIAILKMELFEFSSKN